MKSPLLFATLATFIALPAFGELKNGDFSADKQNWRGPGKVEKSEDGKVLSVTLAKFNFTEVSQVFKMPPGTRRFKVTLQVKAAPDYVFNDKSPKISDVDFKVGGNYTWGALVHPKSDFHIRVKDETSYFHYKLAAVPLDTWTTVTAEIRDIKKPNAIDLVLVFPPGDGTMKVKQVKIESLAE
jgi:hypothetical protein